MSAPGELGFVPDEEAHQADALGFTPETGLQKGGRLALTGVQKLAMAMDAQRAATTSPAIANLLGVSRPGDVENALSLQAPAPTPVELAERKWGAFPTGPRVSDIYPPAKGKWYDATTKGAIDTALTAATDPATYESMGLSAAAKGGTGMLAKLARALGMANESGLTGAGRVANAVVNPAESFLGNRAKNSYKNAFEKVDRFAEQNGKTIVPSTLLRKEGFVGGMDSATQAVKDMNENAGSKIGDIISQADSQGVKVPLLESLQPAMEKASQLRSLGTEEATKLATDIDNRVMELVQAHGENAPIGKVQEVKKFLDDLIKDSGYAQGPEAALSTQARKQVASKGLKPGIEAAIPEALQPAFKQAKQVYSSTAPLVTDKMAQISNQAKELRGAFGLSDVDLMLMGLGGAGGFALNGPQGSGEGALGALALKKFGNALRSTAGRTFTGRALDMAGPLTGGATDIGLRRGAWSLLNQGDKK